MKYVIIGGSAAGVTAAETIRKQDKKADITVISDEALPLYSRCLLTYFIAGAVDENKLLFKNKDFYKENNIKTYFGKKAVSIERSKKIVSLEGAAAIPYDKLLIATGGSPKSVDAPGVDKKGVFTIRKIEDARAIIGMMNKVKSIAVLGGGLIGLRDAYALKQRNKEITVIVKSPQILSQMVDHDAAGMIAKVLEKNGIKTMTGVAAKEILGKDSVEGIMLDNGKSVECQMVIIGKGVTPNTGLASACGLEVKDGIVVDEFLQTSDKNIFAAGDVVETYDVARGIKRINALWPCAVEQGETAGLNMAGKKCPYDGSLSMNSVDFFGLASISMGITKPPLDKLGMAPSEIKRPKVKENYEIISQTTECAYRKFVLKENRIVGMVLVGDIKPAGIIGILIKSRVDISLIKDTLLDENFNYAKIMPLVEKFKDCFKQEECKAAIISYKL